MTSREYAQPGKYLVYLGLAVVFVIAFGLRLDVINNTVIDGPIRADAFEYYNYALNMKTHGVFSPQHLSASVPVPDAGRPPVYPLFLVPLVEYPPTAQMLWKINFFQILLGSLSVLLAFAVFRYFLPGVWSLCAALLVSISPHLISASTFVLTETLFTFLLLLSIWLTIRLFVSGNAGVAILAGMVIAGCALTRSTLQYFVFIVCMLLVYQMGWRVAARLAIPLVLGFALVTGPWILRNYLSTGHTSDPSLLINTLHHGSYPDLMYDDIPATKGFAYRFDPESPELSKNIGSVLSGISRRVKEDPGKYLQWYLFGKPVMLFAWNIMDDVRKSVFIFPVSESPYLSEPLFMWMYSLMKSIHWVLVVLAFVASIYVFTGAASKRISREALLALRLLSALLFYFLFLHMIGAPYPRYSIPLRPFIYGLALFMLSHLFSRCAPVFSGHSNDDRTR